MKDFNTDFLHAYFICGSQDVPEGKTLPGIVAEALAAGITAFQLRDKGSNSTLSEAERLPMAQKLHQLCQSYQVPFFIDDDVQLAQQVHAEGVHVGQSDEEIRQVIKEVGSQMVIGYSCSNLTQVEQANKISGIDYYGSGPIYATQSKSDADPEIGIAGLSQLVKSTTRPIVAIGGITASDLSAIAKTKAAGAAVISLIAQSNDIKQTVSQMLTAPWVKND